MKTKELIRQLQEADPSGEIECCVNNADIHFVNVEPAYWDGCLQVLKRDETNPYYNIIGAKYTSKGDKVVIRPLSISDAVFENQDLPVEFEGLNPDREAGYKKRLDERRRQTEEISNDVERGFFVEYMVKKYANESGDFEPEEIKKLASEFHVENMDYRDPMPEDLLHLKVMSKISNDPNVPKVEVGASWHDKRCRQWDKEITLDFAEGKLVFKKT
jgi:hypothetical protein